MKIIYDVTYELKGDCGYSSPVVLEFDNLEDFKAQVLDDYSSLDYRIAFFSADFDERCRVSFNYPCRVDVFALYNGFKIRLAKDENCHISDLLHNMEEYNNYQF